MAGQGCSSFEHYCLLRLALVAFCGAVAADGKRPPNVVFLLADDLGYGDLGSFGQQKIRTPHLDRMAAEGMRLTQHYSGNAVCAPVTVRADDRDAPGPRLHPQQSRGQAGRAVSDAGRYRHAGQIARAARLRDRWIRQVGIGTAAQPFHARSGKDSTTSLGTSARAWPTTTIRRYLWSDDEHVLLENPGLLRAPAAAGRRRPVRPGQLPAVFGHASMRRT